MSCGVDGSRVPVPSLNVTLPLAEFPEEGATWAVNVTDFPYVDGFADTVSEVAVDARLTISVTGGEVLAVSIDVPL